MASFWVSGCRVAKIFAFTRRCARACSQWRRPDTNRNFRLQVKAEKKGKAVDARCRDMTNATAKARWEADPESVELCSFHEVGALTFALIRANSDHLGLQELGQLDPDRLLPMGVHTLDDVKAYGIKHGICPYFGIRRMVRDTRTETLDAEAYTPNSSVRPRQRRHLLVPLPPRSKSC